MTSLAGGARAPRLRARVPSWRAPLKTVAARRPLTPAPRPRAVARPPDRASSGAFLPHLSSPAGRRLQQAVARSVAVSSGGSASATTAATSLTAPALAEAAALSVNGGVAVADKKVDPHHESHSQPLKPTIRP